MDRRVSLLILPVVLLFVGCKPEPEAARDDPPSEILQHVEAKFTKLFPQRGESRFLKIPADDGVLFAELRGLAVSPVVIKPEISEAERLNGITERYELMWGTAKVVRVAHIPKSESEERSTQAKLDWSEWVDVESTVAYLKALSVPGIEVIRKNAKITSVFDPEFDFTKSPQERADRVWITHKPEEFTDGELALLPP